jgi:hypothetical protein
VIALEHAQLLVAEAELVAPAVELVDRANRARCM